LLLLACLALGCVSRQTITKSPVTLDTPKPSLELSHCLKLLKKHDQSTRATEDVLSAASKIFAEIKFVGLSKYEVKELIGKPLKKDGNKWLYSFHTGWIGVVRRFHFNSDGKVEKVQIIPTQ